MSGIERFKVLTESLLPARAIQEHWPIRFDHCFKRICLDAAFEDCWYDHLAKPAERHIQEPYLTQAIEAGEAMLEHGRPELERLNSLSLLYRNKRKRKTVFAETGGPL